MAKLIVCVCSSRLQLRMKVADGFLAKFQLSESEVKALRGLRDQSVNKVGGNGLSIKILVVAEIRAIGRTTDI